MRTLYLLVYLSALVGVAPNLDILSNPTAEPVALQQLDTYSGVFNPVAVESSSFEPVVAEPLTQAAYTTTPLPAPAYLTEKELNQRFTGLLSHVRWLLMQPKLTSIQNNSNGDLADEVDLLRRQIFSYMDDVPDDLKSLSDNIAEDIADTELSLTESGTFNNSTHTGITYISGMLGIGTSSPSDVLAVNGAIYLSDIIPASSISRLYNSGGDLYWNGSLIAGGAVGNWTDNGGDVYRATGNVGIGTSSPMTKLAVVGNFYLNGIISGAVWNGTSISDAYIDNNITASNYLPLSSWYATTTDVLDEGLSNFYFTSSRFNTSFDSRLAATTTDALTEGSTNRYSRWGINGSALYYSTGNIGIGTTSPYAKLSVVGDLALTGGIYDNNSTRGTNGQILQTTGTGVQWVATSSLGISGTTLFTGLTDTQSSLTANRVLFTNSGGTAITDSANFTFNGTNLNLGASNGLAFGGTRFLYASTTNGSIAIGENAGANFNAGTSFNVAIGYKAGQLSSATSSFGNNFIGYQAGASSSNYYNNIFGVSAGYRNSGTHNNIMGREAGYYNQGSSNNFFGYYAGNLSSGSDNNFFGQYAGASSGGSSNNNFFGSSAGQSNSGSHNNILGQLAGETNSGSFNNMMGWLVGKNNKGSYNNYFGQAAGSNNIGMYNDFIGHGAGALIQATATVAIGSGALSGGTDFFIGTPFQAVNNTAIGYRAGYIAATGANNNILLGYQAADNLTTGNNNIVIGYDVDLVSATAANRLNIGNLIFGTGVDGTGTTLSSGNVGIGTTSPYAKLSVVGDLALTGGIYDNNATRGTGGQILQTTGTGLQWVATSTLGLSSSFTNSSQLAALLSDETGTGATVFGTTPTFTTRITTPIVLGGTAASQSLILQSTSGVGTTDSIQFKGGNNGATQLGKLDLGTTNNVAFGSNAGATFNSLSTYNVALGFEAGRYASTSNSDHNNFMGYQAGLRNTGSANNMFGYQTGQDNVGGSNNFIGTLAGSRNTGSTNNFFGINTGEYNSGNSNTFFGGNTGRFNTGSNNNSFGLYSAEYNTGSDNNILGQYAGRNNTGSDNNLFGQYSGYKNTGINNNFIGRFTGYENTGNHNVFLGDIAGNVLQSTSTVIVGALAFGKGLPGFTTPFQAINNTAIGYMAGYNAQTGSNNNILLGYQAADNLTTGNNNIVIGYDVDLTTATAANTLNIGNLIFGTGINGVGTTLSTGNIGIGTTTPFAKLSVVGAAGGSYPFYVASSSGAQLLSVDKRGVLTIGAGGTASLYINGGGSTVSPATTGTYNTIVGNEAFTYQTAGSVYNTALGYQALYGSSTQLMTGGFNTVLGYQAGYSNTTGGSNSFLGYKAGYSNTTGSSNSFMGVGAGTYNTTGSDNTTNGANTLVFNTTGSSNTANGTYALLSNTTGSFNVALGNSAGRHNQTGGGNVAVGYDAGKGTFLSSYASSTILGYSAGSFLTTGSMNLLLGYQAADNLTTGSNNIIIGYDIDASSATANNTLNIGNLIFGTGINGVGTTLSTGNIGIGTTSPYAKLSVTGSGVFTGTLTASSFSASSLMSAPYFMATNASATSTFAGNISLDGDYRWQDKTVLTTDGSGGAIGLNNSYTSSGFSVGSGNQANNMSASSIGSQNVASGLFSSAVGSGNTASGLFSNAFGYASEATSTNATAFGVGNIAGGDSSVAFGFGNTVYAAGSVAVGNGITNTTANSLMIGPSNTAKLTILSTGNVGVGTTSPYAKLSVAGQVAADYFTAASTTATSTFAGNLSIDGQYKWQGQTVFTTNGFGGAIGLGNSYTSSGFAVGVNNQAKQVFASSIGTQNLADGLFTSAIGYSNTATGINAVALGFVNYATTTSATALGNANHAEGIQSVAMGFNNYASADNSIAIGSNVINNIASSLQIGPSDLAKLTILSTGNVGIGTTSPYAKLSVVGQVVADSFFSSSAATSTFYGPIEIGQSQNLLSGLSVSKSGAAGSTVYGIYSGAGGAGGANISNGYGVYSRAVGTSSAYALFTQLSGSSGINNGYGLRTTSVFNGTGINNAYGVYVESLVGANNSAYGLYLENMGSGANNYAVYAAGTTDKSYFGGNVGIGTTSPNAKLNVYSTLNTNGQIGGLSTDLKFTSNAGGSNYGNKTSLNIVSAVYPSPTNIYLNHTSLTSSCLACGLISTYGSYVSFVDAISNGPKYGFYADSAGSTYATDSFFANLADTSTGYTASSSASFTGKFLEFMKGGVSQFVVNSSGNVGIGSSTPGYKLAVAGSIYASSFIDDGITIGAPDYVFDDPNYNHLSIEDIRNFIGENDHLPWLTPRGPGAMSLSVRINEVLEGLENLYLKVFDLVDWNKEQDNEISTLKNENELLRHRLEQIENQLNLDTPPEPATTTEPPVVTEPDVTDTEPEPEPEIEPEIEPELPPAENTPEPVITEIIETPVEPESVTSISSESVSVSTEPL